MRPAILIAPLLAACGWSVRVEPEAKGAPGAPAATATGEVALSSPTDRQTQQLYANRCGRCHVPFPPTHATAEGWPRILRKYGPRAQLYGAERDRVQQWLQARARS